MKKSLLFTGLGLIIGTVVVWGALILVVFFIFFGIGGDGGIIAGTITATIGGAICLAFGILIIMVGVVLLIVGAVTDDDKKEK
ncbi:MAG: hypothetical protein ACYTFG_22310 [Planctomycetota bacterium]|jgi:hypothetical protein